MAKKLARTGYFEPDGFPIAVNRPHPQRPMGLHSHDFTELVVILGGSGLHLTEDETYPICAGDVFVISGERAHGYDRTEELRLVNILYDPKRLHMPLRDLRTVPGYHAVFTLEPRYRKRHRFESRLRLSADDLARVEERVDLLDEELAARGDGYRFMATALLMQIVGHVSRCYGRSRTTASRSLIRLGEAIGYLENHYDRPVALEDLARIAHMSARHFMRTFREALGASPIEYLIRVRIARALELLRSEELSISEIAYRVGFEDSNYFARQFRKIKGGSPREFRSLLAGGAPR